MLLLFILAGSSPVKQLAPKVIRHFEISAREALVGNIPVPKNVGHTIIWHNSSKSIYSRFPTCFLSSKDPQIISIFQTLRNQNPFGLHAELLEAPIRWVTDIDDSLPEEMQNLKLRLFHEQAFEEKLIKFISEGKFKGDPYTLSAQLKRAQRNMEEIATSIQQLSQDPAYMTQLNILLNHSLAPK